MSDNRTLEFIKGLIVGGAIGAIAAILYAPKSGRETRQELAGKVDDIYGKAREEYEASLERAKRTYESTVNRIKDLENVAKTKAEEMEEVVGDVLEKSKEHVDESKNRLKSALDAAKNAFKEEKEKLVKNEPTENEN
jgi:gas vesicle protein